MVTILFLSANPSDTDPLRLAEESREIRDQLKKSKERDGFHFEQRDAVRPMDLTQAIFDISPNVVHFSGHGEKDGAICLETGAGHTQPVTPDALANLFAIIAGTVSCVVLNACYSQPQAEAIAQHIPFVIGMSDSIGDEAAIAFSVGFYQALGAGREVEEAYQFGCVQVGFHDSSQHKIPILHKRQPANP